MVPDLGFNSSSFADSQGVTASPGTPSKMLSFKSPSTVGSAAITDEDVALWLHNKLGSSDANWCSSQLASQLTSSNTALIPNVFSNLNPHVKYRLLMAFLFIPKRNIEDVRSQMEMVVCVALQDEDSWVVTIAHAVENYLTHGHISLDCLLALTPFEQVAATTKSALASFDSNTLLPLECPILCKKALTQIVAAEPPSQKHFTLRRKSKSQVQRNELLQKCADLLNSEAKLNRSSSGSGGGLSIPVRSKTAPSRLKLGQMKNMSLSGGMGQMSPFSPQQKITSSDSSTNRFKDNKRGGAKLIEIMDQPLGGPAGRMKKHKSSVVISNPSSKPDPSNEENRTIDESIKKPKEEAQAEVAIEVADANRQMTSGSELEDSKSGDLYNALSTQRSDDTSVCKREAEHEMPEYAVGLSAYPLKTENLGSLSYTNFSPSPYSNIFPSMGVATSRAASGYSPYEHDYAPKETSVNDSYSEYNNSSSLMNSLYSKIPNDYPGSENNQNSSNASMDTPGTSHLNFFQSPLGLGSNRNSDNSVASPSVSIANIANQLQAFANQNSHQSFPQMQQGPSTSSQSTQPLTTPKIVANTPPIIPNTGRSTLDQLLSRADKLTPADRQKIERFLRGEKVADVDNPDCSKVSVTLSEKRVPSEIRGELCSAVVSTVFEMDYLNGKWKVVKHTSVVKPPKPH